MNKITDEMRDRLREPLPGEAVSPHPTKSYLSSIKSIYVVERINDVFGLGTWTLKSEIVERLEKFVVVKTILEIPSYGFYGEAYGGNDNVDIGDAYKGATTDGFTKIAGQQLEIGIDVFKGIRSQPSQKPSPSPSVDQLYQLVADNMKWKNTTASRSFIVNKCKITEERIDNDTEAVLNEVKQLQGW